MSKRRDSGPLYISLVSLVFGVMSVLAFRSRHALNPAVDFQPYFVLALLATLGIVVASVVARTNSRVAELESMIAELQEPERVKRMIAEFQEEKRLEKNGC